MLMIQTGRVHVADQLSLTYPAFLPSRQLMYRSVSTSVSLTTDETQILTNQTTQR